MKLLYMGLLTLVVAVTLTCGIKPGHSQVSDYRERSDVQVILTSRTQKVRASGNIVLWLSVMNCGKKPIPIDGRMMWPGNVNLWVQTPGSAGESSGSETVRFRISQPTRAEMVTLRPGCFYGTEMVVGPKSCTRLVDKLLKRLKRGRYTFRAVYYSPDVPKLGLKGFEESSNKVSVVVE